MHQFKIYHKLINLQIRYTIVEFVEYLYIASSHSSRNLLLHFTLVERTRPSHDHFFLLKNFEILIFLIQRML